MTFYSYQGVILLNNQIDVIGIGAINFDCIYSSKKADEKKNKNIDDGEEIFVSYQDLEQSFKKIQKNADFTQLEIGGSALLSIRTLKSICPELTTAYVGVYGKVPSEIKKSHLPLANTDIKSYLSTFIDDTSWLFKDDKSFTGCALVNLYRHQRQFIHINTGANKNLQKRIHNMGEDSFVTFLASAKWIHITSLQSINDFIKIINCVKKAKSLNSNLRISIDPGYDYMKNHWQIFAENQWWSGFMSK